MKKMTLIFLVAGTGIIVFSLVAFFLKPVSFRQAGNRKSTETTERPKPNDWMAMQRTYPYGKINPAAYLSAVNQTDNMMKAADNRNNPWTFAGPLNIGGRITDIEVPDNEPSTLYVGAATGGILKTTDAGQTWEHMGLDHSAYIGRVIVDYSNSNRVFAAACGNLFTTSDERGIYRSLDGGQTWERSLFISDSTSAIDLVQHPGNPQVLYAAMWERARGLSYRRSFGQSSGIWKSTDGGNTWAELNNGLPKGNHVGRIGLSMSRSNPNILYAFYDLASGDVGVYKTTNDGQTWVRTNDGALNGMNSNFGWYFGQIRVNPLDPDQVFVMGVYLFLTNNGGNSWQEANNYDIHVDHHAMTFDNNNRMLEGNDGGLYYSDTYGNSWTKINNLPITQFYAIDIDYQQPQRICGGTQDNNTIRTLSGGTDDWFPFLGGDGMYTLIDYTDSDILYAESQWGNLYRSFDGGLNLEYIAEPISGDRVNWSAPLAMHPEVPSTLYFGTYRVWKTTDYGSSWQAVSSDLTHGINEYFYTLTTIAISKLNPAIVITGSGDGKVFISTNEGQTWQDISSGLPNRWVTRVAADPFNVQTIYATLSGFRWDEPLPHVFKSVNLGQTWVDISGNLPEFPVNDLVIDPDLPGRMVAGTDAGLYGTTDGGQTWSWIWSGLPAVPVYTLKLHDQSRTIVAGTYGLSAYKASLDEIFTGIPNNEKPVRINLIASPNPSGDIFRLNFFLPERSPVSVKLFRTNGILQKIIFTGQAKKGENSITFNTETETTAIPNGIYLVTIESEQYQGITKIIKISN